MAELYLIRNEPYSPDTEEGLELLGRLTLEGAQHLDRLQITNTSDHTRFEFFEDQQWTVDAVQQWLKVLNARRAALANTPGFKSPVLDEFAHAFETAAKESKGLYFCCD